MTQEDKELLLKDLCARLLYGLKVKCEKYSFPVTILYAGNIDEVKFKETGGIEYICAIKPYLRPMSSMTEEELKEFRACHCVYDLHPDFQPMMCNIANEQSMFDWLNAHHFDYRGLISMGLAIDATGLNIY